jgi:hypothetical protein
VHSMSTRHCCYYNSVMIDSTKTIMVLC